MRERVSERERGRERERACVYTILTPPPLPLLPRLIQLLLLKLSENDSTPLRTPPWYTDTPSSTSTLKQPPRTPRDALTGSVCVCALCLCVYVCVCARVSESVQAIMEDTR